MFPAAYGEDLTRAFNPRKRHVLQQWSKWPESLVTLDLVAAHPQLHVLRYIGRMSCAMAQKETLKTRDAHQSARHKQAHKRMGPGEPQICHQTK